MISFATASSMCFSLQHSLAFTVAGGVLTAWLLSAKASSKFVNLTAYFTLMEVGRELGHKQCTLVIAYVELEL